MAGASDSPSVVQVPPDSTGKRIRTFEVNQIISDGSVASVEVQCIAICNPDGSIVDFRQITALLTDIRDELREMRHAQHLTQGI